MDVFATDLAWVRVLEPNSGKLLFRYDPIRDIIEIQRRGVKTLIDLRAYQERQGERQDASILQT